MKPSELAKQEQDYETFLQVLMCVLDLMQSSHSAIPFA